MKKMRYKRRMRNAVRNHTATIAATPETQNMSSKTAFVTALILAFSLRSALAGGCAASGVLIGSLETLAHGASGTLYALDDETFCIEDFSYDGQGPDAFIYLFFDGDTISNTGGGAYVPVAPGQHQFQLGRAFDNEELVINVSPQFRTCDFSSLTIWCRYASELFATVSWNFTTIFGMEQGLIMCSPSPGRAYVGGLADLAAHDVSGELFIRDNKTLVIRDFTYNGQAPDTFVYWYGPGETVDPNGGGRFIPLPEPEGVAAEEGRFSSIVYTLPRANPDFVITIPDDVDNFTCDMAVFTLWCREAAVFFTTANISSELFTNNPLERDYSPNRILCDRPTTQPGLLVGELPTPNPREASGTFYIQDENTFFIQLFSYPATRENTFLYYFRVGETPVVSGVGGDKIAFSATSVPFPTGKANSFFNRDFTVDLTRAMGGPVTACDIGYFAILDMEVGELLTMIAIPQLDSCPTPETTTSRTSPTIPALELLGTLAVVVMALILKL